MSRVNSRSRLFGQLRAFTERYLCGMVTWDQVKPVPGEPADLRPDGRRNPLGKFKEIAAISFGDYELSVRSPDADPPLGWIMLTVDGDVAVEGPLDQTVWAQVGEYIQNRGMRNNSHGRRETSWLSAG